MLSVNFDALTRYLDRTAERGIPGCDLVVTLGHEVIYRHMSGERGPGKPMRGDEVYVLYSATKLFTMVAGMQLIERGAVRLDDPVSKYLPEYADLTVLDGGEVRPARTVMTVEHLMTMQGGLDYDTDSEPIRACLAKYGQAATTRQLAAAFVQKPLLFDPGTHFRYSLCHDVMAAVIEVASGLRFGEYLRRNVTEPLGMRCMGFSLSEAQLSRMASRYHWDAQERPVEEARTGNFCRISEAHESGGGGLMGDVDSYILLPEALANDGVGRSGAHILTRASIDAMRKNRLTGDSRRDYDVLCEKRGYGYGLGVRTLTDPATSRSPVGEFGWDSAAGAWSMIDVDRRLAAFYAQHVLNCKRAYDEFHPAIRDLIYEGLEA